MHLYYVFIGHNAPLDITVSIMDAPLNPGPNHRFQPLGDRPKPVGDLNIGPIKCHQSDFERFIRLMTNIVLVSETWLDSTINEYKIVPQNYNVFSLD